MEGARAGNAGAGGAPGGASETGEPTTIREAGKGGGGRGAHAGQRSSAPRVDPGREPIEQGGPPPRVGGLPSRADLGPRILAAAGYTVFLVLAIDHIGQGPLRALDGVALRAVPHDGPLYDVSRVVTFLGDQVTLVALTFLGMTLLLRQGAYIGAGVLGLAKASSVLVVGGLKLLFGRLRPDVPFSPYGDVCCSFPSGHATDSAMVLMLLAVLLFEPHRRIRPWVEGVAVGLALVVGATRVILGAHFPTDVVAGWGLGWGLAGSFLLLRVLLQGKKPLPDLVPSGEHVAHGVGLALPQGVHVHVEPGIPVTLEGVAEHGPAAGPPHPLHPKELGVGLQRLVAREHRIQVGRSPP